MQPHQLRGSALLLHPSCTNFSHLSITLADGATAVNCHVCTVTSCSWPVYSLNKALLCWSTAFVRTFVLAQLCSRAIILNPVLIEGKCIRKNISENLLQCLPALMVDAAVACIPSAFLINFPFSNTDCFHLIFFHTLNCYL